MTKTKLKAPKIVRTSQGKPFQVGEYAIALKSIGGCAKGDIMEVLALRGNDCYVQCKLVTGPKNGAEIMCPDTAVDPIEGKNLPPNIKSILKIK